MISTESTDEMPSNFKSNERLQTIYMKQHILPIHLALSNRLSVCNVASLWEMQTQ